MKAWLTLVLFAFHALQLASQCVNRSIDLGCPQFTIGHRGSSHVYPENSLWALEDAFKHGIKICEVDVSLTADSVYVLFHDKPAVHRLLPIAGELSQLTFAEMQGWPMAAYRDDLFAANRVARLVDALRLAERYDAALYLDTKTSNLALLAQAISEAGVQPHRALPSLENLSSAQQWQALVPGGKFVWYAGGSLPSEVPTTSWIQSFIALGCVAFELGWSTVLANPTEFVLLKDLVHAASSEMWAFTVNDNALAAQLIGLGVDRLETDRPVALSRWLCEGLDQAFPDSLTTGNWRFTHSLNNTAGLGSQWRYLNWKEVDSNHRCAFASTDSLSISPMPQGHARIMQVPALPPEQAILAYTNMSVDNDGTTDGTYSWILDFLLPPGSLGNWIALYQTGLGNNDDADLFINPQGQIGITGDYFGQLTENQWYRLIASIDDRQDSIRLFLNGLQIGSIRTYGTRWTTFTNSPSGDKQGFLVFSDNDGETAPLVVSAFQIRDYAIPAYEAALLAGPDSAGIPSGNADLYFPTSIWAVADSVWLDYDAQRYQILLKPNAPLNTLTLDFALSHGAHADVMPHSVVDATSKQVDIQVQSQDLTHAKTWTLCFENSLGTGVAAIEVQQGWAYPNPANQQIHWSLSPETIEVVVFDGQGRLLAQFSTRGQSELSCDTQNWPDGVYLYTAVQSDGRRYCGKFAVSH